MMAQFHPAPAGTLADFTSYLGEGVLLGLGAAVPAALVLSVLVFRAFDQQ